MAHRNYLRSSRYEYQCWLGRRVRLAPHALEFATEFVKFAHKLGIPILIGMGVRSHMAYVMGADDPAFEAGSAVALSHAVKGQAMPAICWRVFAHVGEEVAGKLGCGVQWGGLSAPWLWNVVPK